MAAEPPNMARKIRTLGAEHRCDYGHEAEHAGKNHAQNTHRRRERESCCRPAKPKPARCPGRGEECGSREKMKVPTQRVLQPWRRDREPLMGAMYLR